MSVENNYSGFYYCKEQNGDIGVYTAKSVGPQLKSWDFGDAKGDDLHRLARGRIDLELEELKARDSEMNK